MYNFTTKNKTRLAILKCEQDDKETPQMTDTVNTFHPIPYTWDMGLFRENTHAALGALTTVCRLKASVVPRT